MMRFVGGILGVAMMAGVVHIVTVFGVPRYAVRDPWTAFDRFAPVGGGFATLPTATAAGAAVPGLDPAMAQAVCRFRLDRGPIRIKAAPPEIYWSLSLYDRRGLHVWGIDNRGAGQRSADVLIADDLHVARLRENPPDEFDDVSIVEWKGGEGIALLQVFRLRPSLDDEITKALKAADCRPMPLG